MKRQARTRLAAVVAGAAVLTACTGTRPPTAAPADAQAPVEVQLPDDSVPAPGVAATGPGGADGGLPAGPAAGAQDADAVAGSAVGRARAGGTGGPAGAATSQPPSRPGRHTPALFSASDDRIGITDGEITLCAHAPKYVGRALGVDEEALDVFWEAVNDAGGIHGRRISETVEDDRGGEDDGGVLAAAERCRHKHAFLLRAPHLKYHAVVRRWAEDNRELYLFGSAVEDRSKRYSFSFYPSYERIGQLTGQYVASRHGGRRIGIVRRDDENTRAARGPFLAALRAAGMEPVAERVVPAEGVNYSSEIAEFKRKGVQVVWAVENFLYTRNMIAQAENQGYRPHWVLWFPLNASLTAMNQPPDPPLEGVQVVPAYVPGKTDGPFARYAQDIRQYEAAMRRYHPRSATSDATFAKWMEDKQIAHLLQLCGRDCTRNRFAALMQTGALRAQPSHCPFDFTRDGQVGGYTVNAWQSFSENGRLGWRETASCAERF